jgi:hypothetical protein
LDNLNRLFVERFINGKTRLDLFYSMGMTYKPNDGRPKGSKNKPKAKLTAPKPIDIMAMLMGCGNHTKQQANKFL